jgi:hypothetical protein
MTHRVWDRFAVNTAAPQQLPRGPATMRETAYDPVSFSAGRDCARASASRR